MGGGHGWAVLGCQEAGRVDMHWTLLAVGKQEGFAQLGAMGEVVAGCNAGGLGANQVIGGGHWYAEVGRQGRRRA